jgi:hypothetical protein
MSSPQSPSSIASYHPSMASGSWICIVALAAACSRGPSNERGESAQPTPWESTEATAELARAPNSMSCAKDDDCVPFHGGGTAPPAVCCDGSTTGITTRSYEQWLQAFRAKYCTGAPCKTPSLPGALPADCFFEGRCVKGQCATGCDVK